MWRARKVVGMVAGMVAMGVVVVLLCAASPAAFGQSSGILNMQATAPNPVLSGGAFQRGALGPVPLYYWVSARFPSGLAMPFGPFTVVNTVGVAALSGSDFVRLSWSAAPGATGYYVIRQTVPQFPVSGTCIGCVVVANTAALTFDDVGGGVADWPPAGVPGVSSSTASIQIDNVSGASPFITTTLNGAISRLVVSSVAGGLYGLDLTVGGPWATADIRGSKGGTIVQASSPLGQWQFSPSISTPAARVNGAITGLNADILQNDAAGQWSAVRGSGARTIVRVEGTAFLSLGAVVPGGLVYCTDCAVTGAADNTCAAAGGGALAVGIGAAWRCFYEQNVP